MRDGATGEEIIPLKAEEVAEMAIANMRVQSTCHYIDREIKVHASAGYAFLTFYMAQFADPIEANLAPAIIRNLTDRGFKVTTQDRVTTIKVEWVYER